MLSLRFVNNKLQKVCSCLELCETNVFSYLSDNNEDTLSKLRNTHVKRARFLSKVTLQ